MTFFMRNTREERKILLNILIVFNNLEEAIEQNEFPGGSDDKESACDAGDPGLIPRSGRSPGEGNGYPLQCSCLENFMDRGAWQAPGLGVTKSRTQLRDFQLHFQIYYSITILILQPPPHSPPLLPKDPDAPLRGDISLLPSPG